MPNDCDILIKTAEKSFLYETAGSASETYHFAIPAAVLFVITVIDRAFHLTEKTYEYKAEDTEQTDNNAQNESLPDHFKPSKAASPHDGPYFQLLHLTLFHDFPGLQDGCAAAVGKTFLRYGKRLKNRQTDRRNQIRKEETYGFRKRFFVGRCTGCPSV